MLPRRRLPQNQSNSPESVWPKRNNQTDIGGPGISAVDQARLFQEFQQADNAITKKKGGIGLRARHIQTHHRDARRHNLGRIATRPRLDIYVLTAGRR
jgi:hypothetical protein